MKREIKPCVMGQFFVEYFDPACGIKSSEVWSEQVLLEEIRRGDVEILSISPLLSED